MRESTEAASCTQHVPSLEVDLLLLATPTPMESPKMAMVATTRAMERTSMLHLRGAVLAGDRCVPGRSSSSSSGGNVLMLLHRNNTNQKVSINIHHAGLCKL